MPGLSDGAFDILFIIIMSTWQLLQQCFLKEFMTLQFLGHDDTVLFQCRSQFLYATNIIAAILNMFHLQATYLLIQLHGLINLLQESIIIFVHTQGAITFTTIFFEYKARVPTSSRPI